MRAAYLLVRHLPRSDRCIPFRLAPNHDGVDQWLRFLPRDMSQRRNQLIEIRIRARPADLFDGSVRLSQLQDSLVDLAVRLTDKLCPPVSNTTFNPSRPQVPYRVEQMMQGVFPHSL